MRSFKKYDLSVALARSVERCVDFVSNAVNRADDFLSGQYFSNFLTKIFDVSVDGAVITFKIISLDPVDKLTS